MTPAGPRGWRRLRLGTRLALALGVLALVVFYLVGASTVTTMRSYLMRRLDEQLTQVQFEEVRQLAGGPVARPLPRNWVSGVVAVGTDGGLTLETGSLPSDLLTLGNAANLVSRATARHAPAALSLHTPDSGSMAYRGLATPLGGERVLVTAAPQGDLDYTVHRLFVVEIVTFVAALAVLVIVGSTVLRRGLRSLGDMASTAHDIASTDLTGDVAQLAVRVGGTGGGVEVEELRTAFNVMLAHIDSSLAARSAAEQRLRRFVADASHELRTPLTSIRGYADLFRYPAANEPAEREAHLAHMREEAARMSVLLDDLLLLARLDAAEAPLRTERIDLVELATSAADAFRTTHADHPLTLRAEQTPLPLDADPAQLRQVLDNLLTNAAIHTPDGTDVALTVRAEPQRCVVEVSDAGPGIPAAEQDRVFDRFFRVDDSRARGASRHGSRLGGTGLGLAVVQSVVTAHGGNVTLTSTPGRTTFTARIPAPAHPTTADE